MFLQLFSQYLLDEGITSPEQINAIKDAQKGTRVKLGLIAVSEKMITEKQADEINRKQALMDKRFGDIAVELGYLTDDQVGKLLKLQGNPYMQFAQAASDNGILSLTEIEKHFQGFLEKNGFEESLADAIKADDLDAIIPLYIQDADSSIQDLISVCLRTINRLISTDLCIGKGAFASTYDYDFMASQALTGMQNVTLGFAGGKGGVLQIASTYAQEEFDTIDLDSLDSAGEFINIVNGLYATALSQKEIQVDLVAPNYEENAGSLQEGKIYVVPVAVNQESFEIVVW